MNLFCVVILAFLTGCSAFTSRSVDTQSQAKINLSPDCSRIKDFFDQDLAQYQNRLDKASAEYQDEQWKVEAAEPGNSPQKMGSLFEAYQKVAYDVPLLQKLLELSKASEKVSPQDCIWRERLVRAKQIAETGILTKEEVIRKEKENQETLNPPTTYSYPFMEGK